MVRREGPLEPVAARRGAHRRPRAGRVRSRGRVLHRRRDDDRHQRRPHAQRRARPLPHHEGLRGHPAHPADQPQEPLRLRVAQARPARAPPGLHRHRRATRRRGHRRARARRRRGARGRRRARRRRRRRPRGGRVLPLLVPEPRQRARRPRGARRGRVGLALARDRPDLARVRARHRGDPRRVPQAHRGALRRRRRRGVQGAGRRRALVAAEEQRRACALGRVEPAPGPRPPVGHRGWRDRCELLRARGGRAARRHAGHGRDELRRLPARRRRPALLVGVRDRVRPARRRPDREHEDDRRRRRIDRLDRSRWVPAGRAAERGRRSGPRLLRPRRRGAHAHRRQRRARPPQPRLLPRRQPDARRLAQPRGARALRAGSAGTR